MERRSTPDRRRWSCLHEGHEEREAAHTKRIQAELERRRHTPESREDLSALMGRLVEEYT